MPYGRCVYGKKGRYEATLEAADPHVATQTRLTVRVPWNQPPVINSLTVALGDYHSCGIRNNDSLWCW
jgi:hypothetical protein